VGRGAAIVRHSRGATAGDPRRSPARPRCPSLVGRRDRRRGARAKRRLPGPAAGERAATLGEHSGRAGARGVPGRPRPAPYHALPLRRSRPRRVATLPRRARQAGARCHGRRSAAHLQPGPRRRLGGVRGLFRSLRRRRRGAPPALRRSRGARRAILLARGAAALCRGGACATRRGLLPDLDPERGLPQGTRCRDRPAPAESHLRRLERGHRRSPLRTRGARRRRPLARRPSRRTRHATPTCTTARS